MDNHEVVRLKKIKESYSSEGQHRLNIQVHGLFEGEAAKSLIRLYDMADLVGLDHGDLLTFLIGKGVQRLESDSGLIQEDMSDKLQKALEKLSNNLGDLVLSVSELAGYIHLYTTIKILKTKIDPRPRRNVK